MKAGSTKQPYFIRMKNDRTFAFTGLSEHWHHDDQVIDSAINLATVQLDTISATGCVE
jgi:putative SOS response-associated peptidase YedK